MLVKELITKLQAVPPEAIVVLQNDGKRVPTITMPDYIDLCAGTRHVIISHG